MIMKKLIYIFLLFPIIFLGQDDLLNEIDQEPTDSYATALFKGLKIVNFESTKLTAKRDRIILYSLERYLIDLVLHLSIQGSRKRTKIASPIVKTPPNLSGIALKIA